MRRAHLALVSLVASLALIVTACGDDNGDGDLPEDTGDSVSEVTEELDDARSAYEEATDLGASSGSEADGGGSKVSVAVSDLRGYLGQDLAGVLLSDTAFGGTAVGGFAVTVDSDPFSDVQVLGSVSEESREVGMWPWAEGVARIPAGSYTLRIAVGTDYCCYSQWMPAETADLRICEVGVTTSGEDQIIEVNDVPRRGRCGMP